MCHSTHIEDNTRCQPLPSTVFETGSLQASPQASVKSDSASHFSEELLELQILFLLIRLWCGFRNLNSCFCGQNFYPRSHLPNPQLGTIKCANMQFCKVAIHFFF